MKFKAFLVYGILLLIIALVLSLLIFNADKRTLKFADLENDDTVLVKVDGQNITSGDLKKEIVDLKVYKPLDNREKLANLEKALHEIVVDKIHVLLAEKKNIKITDHDVQHEVDSFISLHGEENFDRLLRSQNMTMEDFRNVVHDELVKKRLQESIISELKSEITISNEDVAGFYDKNKEMYNISDLAHIYIQIKPPFEENDIQAAKKKSEKIIELLNNGADFALIARKYSDDASTKNDGGFLGPMTRGNLAVAIREEASRLKEGAFSQLPLRIQSGFIIIKRLNSRYQEIAEVREEILERLIEPKLAKAYANYLQEVEADADVQYMFKFSD